MSFACASCTDARGSTAARDADLGQALAGGDWWGRRGSLHALPGSRLPAGLRVAAKAATRAGSHLATLDTQSSAAAEDMKGATVSNSLGLGGHWMESKAVFAWADTLHTHAELWLKGSLQGFA